MDRDKYVQTTITKVMYVHKNTRDIGFMLRCFAVGYGEIVLRRNVPPPPPPPPPTFAPSSKCSLSLPNKNADEFDFICDLVGHFFSAVCIVWRCTQSLYQTITLVMFAYVPFPQILKVNHLEGTAQNRSENRTKTYRESHSFKHFETMIN